MTSLSSVTLKHFETLKEIFKVFIANRLQLRINKYKFLQIEIEFVGHLISEKGISPTQEGIITIHKIPISRNMKEVRSFVALCSYFHKFIRSFAIIAFANYMIY